MKMEFRLCWLSLLIILLNINENQSTEDTTGWIIYSETDTIVAYAHEILNRIKGWTGEDFALNFRVQLITNTYFDTPTLMDYYYINPSDRHSCIVESGNMQDLLGDDTHIPQQTELEKFINNKNPRMKKKCNVRQSLNQYIYDLYNIILVRFIKFISHKVIMCRKNTFYMSKMLSTIVQSNTQTDSMCFKNFVDMFHEYLKNLTDEFRAAINGSSRDIYRHDPTHHKKGVTYEVLKSSTCHYKTYEMGLNQNSTSVNITDFNRSIENLGALYSVGTGGTVDSKNEETNDQQNRKICESCECIRAKKDSSQPIQYINLRPQHTNTAMGYVVTGIRFRFINRVLYLQVQEGQLKHGIIDKKTVAWIEVNATKHNYENNLDLLELNYDYPIIDLSETTLPSTHAVTMVKISATINRTIHLEIQGLRVIGGELYASQPQMLTNSSQLTNRIEAVHAPVHSNIPTLLSSHNTIFTEPNKYFMTFQSLHDNNNTEHILVPFIDIKNVVTSPPTSVVGVGIYLRYGQTSSGFLAPKLIGMDNEIKIQHLMRQFHINFTAVEY